MRKLWGMIQQTATQWSNHEATRMGAALAYYSILSLAPLAILMVAIVAVVLGERSAQGQITGQIQNAVGPQAAKAIQDVIANASRPSASGWAAAVGVITLLFGASAVFIELHSDLNTIWDVQPNGSAGLKGLIWDRIFSFMMILGIGFLLLVSLLASAVLVAVEEYFSNVLPLSPAALDWLNFAVSFAVISVLFAFIFKYVPDVDIEWRDVWLGAVATALLFTVGKLLIGLYIGKAGVGSAYGAAGSLVVFLVWIYYSAQIFLFGAEFTKVYADTSGSKPSARRGPGLQSRLERVMPGRQSDRKVS